MISWKELYQSPDFAWYRRDTSRPRQMTDIQYDITIVGGREVSRHTGFFAEGERFFILLAMPPTSQEGGVRGVVWLIQAPA